MSEKLKKKAIIARKRFEDFKDGDTITDKEWNELQSFMPAGFGYSITKRVAKKSIVVFERYLPIPECKNDLDAVFITVSNSKQTIKKHLKAGDDGARGKISKEKLAKISR